MRVERPVVVTSEGNSDPQNLAIWGDDKDGPSKTSTNASAHPQNDLTSTPKLLNLRDEIYEYRKKK